MIKKVVLTGGPSSGKTTVLNSIVKEFNKHFVKVIVVPETATELITAGVRMFGEDKIDALDFQELVIRTMIFKEDNYYKAAEMELHEAAKLLKTTPAGILEKINALQAELKTVLSENESLKSKLAKDALGDVMDQVCEIEGVKFLPAKLEGVDMNGLRELGDQLREKLGEGVVLLASVNDGKVNLMAAATDGAMKQGAHAGNLIKGIAALVGGGGGGRPNMAQAGGKNPAGIDEALEKAKEVLKGQVNR